MYFDNETSPYLISKQKLLKKLNSSSQHGLPRREAHKRLRKYGYNNLDKHNNSGPILIFFAQFNDFMIIVLIVATLLSLIMGEMSDAVTIFSIIILNAVMGFIQEYKAEKALSKLKKLAAPQARVKRDGEIREITADLLVPGDIILLEMGDKIPADARILETDGLQVDESLLTGESIPVTKRDETLYAEGLEPADQTNMLFMGTNITQGKARALVVNTGSNTEMGKIATLLENKGRKMTPLQKRLRSLGKWLVLFSLVFTFLIVGIGILKGQSIYQMFLAGISLAVAAIPEGLPAIVTLALAFGVQKMIKKKAIVRKLPAVETLGCATIICSDKTGTLTQNKMTLKKVMYNGQIKSFEKSQKNNELAKLLEIGALCNMSQPRDENKKGALEKVKNIFTSPQPPSLYGDPTDIALVRAIYEKDLTLENLQGEYQLLKVREFTSEARSMSVLIESSSDRKKELLIKGAPEVIIEKCTQYQLQGKKNSLNQNLKNDILKAAESMAGKALRVLALAYRPINNKRINNLESQENNMVFVGLVGLLDPPRPEVYQAVEECHSAGIKPIMITGDHALTARVIAEEVGIIDRYGKVLEGSELKQLSEQQQRNLIKNRRVFARINPTDKLKIVKTLQESNEIVAMTGDGVNDAPAIKQADIGIAMGQKGTDVTREVASLVLADDNFATIVEAIKEGRKIYNNIRKFIRYLLSCNIGELLTIFFGITLGLPLPLLPIQILWVNLVTDGLPALALSMEDEEEGIMNQSPRSPNESIFAHGMVGAISSQGALIGLSTIFAYLIALYRLNLDINTARTMAFSTLVFSQLFFVFSCRSEKHAFWQLNPFGNIYLLGAVFLSTIMQLGVIYHPFLAQFFATMPLTLKHWGLVLLLSSWSTLFLEMIYPLYGTND